jgi:hypothetical protein
MFVSAIEEKVMPNKYIFLFLILIGLGVAGTSYIWQSGQKYEFDKTSPNGLYRIRVEFREEAGKGTREYTERLKIQYFKKEELIYTEESENPFQYEPSIRLDKGEVEWVSDNILRMGDDLSGQPFYDEISISNNTSENLKRIGIGFGRFEGFMAFDLAPGNHITLHASPRFKPDGSSNYFVGYSGITESGKTFQGRKEYIQRKSSTDGPLKFQITIDQNGLK